MVNLDYLSKDYEAFRSEMIRLIPLLTPDWTDTSSSDQGIVILELVAFGHDIISYYQDRLANETYLPTATQRQSVIDICKLIDYRLREAIPSVVNLVFEITPDATNETRIPAGFQVSTEASGDEEEIVFELNDDLVIPAGNTGLEKDVDGNYLYTVSATQGITVNDIVGSSNGKPNQTFRLRFPNTTEVSIYVNEGAGFTLWRDVTTELVQITEDGRHYWHDIDSEGYTNISFGSGTDGKIPVEGFENIQATYRVIKGSETNVGANMITRMVSPLSRLKNVFNPKSATGGVDAETIEEAKVNAPQSLRTSHRAVTRGDYVTLAKENARVLKAYAERDEANTQLVKVYIIPRPDADATMVKKEVYDYIDALKVVTTQLLVLDGMRQYLDVGILVTIDSLSDIETVKSFIQGAVEEEMDEAIREFGQGENLFDMFPAVAYISGINNLKITKFTNIPQVNSHTVSGNPTWTTLPTINEGSTLRGIWRVYMTDATHFNVHFSATGAFAGEEIAKGTGTFGTSFNSSGGEITFKITAGTIPMHTADYWTFKTQPYLDDVIIDGNEFLTLGKVTITTV